MMMMMMRQHAHHHHHLPTRRALWMDDESLHPSSLLPRWARSRVRRPRRTTQVHAAAGIKIIRYLFFLPQQQDRRRRRDAPAPPGRHPSATTPTAKLGQRRALPVVRRQRRARARDGRPAGSRPAGIDKPRSPSRGGGAAVDHVM
jgi:hypothetical protein